MQKRNLALVPLVLVALATSAAAGTVLYDDFEDNDISNWWNSPIPRNWVDILNRGDDGEIPVVANGKVMGTDYGYHHGRWMTQAVGFNAAEFNVRFDAQAGQGAIGQSSVILADTSWGGNLTRLVGYELNVYGEAARELWIVQHNGNAPSVRIATYAIGSAIFSMNGYEVSRDASGNWTVLMNGTTLTPVSTQADLTYTDFDYVALSMGTPDTQFDSIGIHAVPLPGGLLSGIGLLATLGIARSLRRRRLKRSRL